MRVGLVCEGPSDIPAVVHFLGDQLRRTGIEPIFHNLFPEPDKTRPEGGWSNLLLWLQRNPPDTRVARYFSGGIFGGGANQEPFDAILIQIDADVLDDEGFRNYVQQKLNIQIGATDEPNERASTLANVVETAGGFSLLTQADLQRHVVAVAVEATEAWCVAAFRAQPDQFEALKGADLTSAFMQALEVSEGRPPQGAYAQCNKDARRREKFCAMFAKYSDRILGSCPNFSATVQALRGALPPAP